MRPAKLFFGVLFAAVFVVTLLKVLFFGLIAVAVFGGIFFVARTFRRFSGRGYGPPGYFPHASDRWQPHFLEQERSPYAQPLDPNWQPRQRATPLGRRIEVL